MAKNGKKKGMADPTRLAAFDGDLDEVQVIIETPKGSRNKFAFDAEQKVFQLKRVLPVGMAFPYDFGFVPSTVAEDGDPTDVLVLMDEPAFPGCLLKCRPIGVIEGKEGSKKEWKRNDRIVAIERDNHTFPQVKHVDELGSKFVAELEDFFVNYRELSGKQYKILKVRGPREAKRRIRDGMKAYEQGRKN